MSCDYAVWHTMARLNARQAGELHLRLCDGDVSGVAPHPGIDAFYAEITALHPEIDDIPEDRIDDRDVCPWSVAFDRSEGHLILCCVWSKADEVGRLVSRLADKHGLAFYDPQSERIVYPRASSGESLSESPEKSDAAKPWWKFW
jgi:hypothetical protein